MFCAFRSFSLLSLVLLACEAPSGGSSDEFGEEFGSDASSEGEVDETGTGVDETAGTGESAADTTGDDASETGSSCPEPSVPPQPIETDEFHCSPGFVYDAAYELCASESEAIGPFPPAMVEACLACGGVDCDAQRWPADQARGLRGTDPCWPGTSELASLCVDDEHAWGPFSPQMVADCKQAGGGEVTCESMRWAREFAENLLPPALGLDWVWIMPIDVGLRDDASGGGAFSAPRLNNPGGHSGIDVLAPVGTPLLAPCAGPIMAGYDGGYGNWVQLACPLPEVLAQGEALWVSILFAHLDTLDVGDGQDVAAGEQLGSVGKTGNAAGAGINPHVHYEIALHSSLAAAQSESHASSDHSSNAAGDAFESRFQSECLDELGFTSLDGPIMKGRRVDPFMLMSCLSSDKPTLESPGPALQSVPTPWSAEYDALAFDVDAGL
jgi:hypothetical protein